MCACASMCGDLDTLRRACMVRLWRVRAYVLWGCQLFPHKYELSAAAKRGARLMY